MKAKKILERYQLKPKKSWGQNFLISEQILQKIVRALDPKPEDWVLELGAGTGALTAPLAERAAKVYAIERDPDLLNLLKTELSHLNNLEIIAANASTFPLSEINSPHPLLVAGNLPYQISAPILFHLQRERSHFSRAVLMLQKEVAERLSAKPTSGKNYSILSVIFSTFFKIELISTVSKANFFPRPKVDSAIVRITTLKRPAVEIDDEQFFIKTVKIAFAQRRKTLLNNLRAALPNAPKEELIELLSSIQIEPGVRGKP